MDCRKLVMLALEEDLGSGDITTLSCVPLEASGYGEIMAKQDLVVCGHEAATEVFRQLGNRFSATVMYETWVPDGTRVGAGEVVARVDGMLQPLLMGERLALNLLMRLSGIATYVRSFVDAVGEGGPKIVDTRKTTPLLRALEKQAVLAGGARNHRMGLYDGVMIKDTHIVAAGGITEAVRQARSCVHHLVRVEVEVSSLDEVSEALEAGAEVLLLDNMDNETLAMAIRQARTLRPGVFLEASGNMNVQRVKEIKHLGLDAVSVGALIHQATWADLSLKMRQRSV